MLTTLEKLKTSQRANTNRIHRPLKRPTRPELVQRAPLSFRGLLKRLLGRKVVAVEPQAAQAAEALVAKGFTTEEISFLLSTEPTGAQETLMRRELAAPQELTQAELSHRLM